MPTRVMHAVRVRNKNNPTEFIDFWVLDAVAFQLPNGVAVLWDVQKSNRRIWINDNTGDGNGVGNNPGNATRLSHMDQLSNPQQPGNIVDLEFLDAFVVSTPYTEQGQGGEAYTGDENDKPELNQGLNNPGDEGGVDVLREMPLDEAVTRIVDNTGLGLAADPAKPTRVGHISCVTQYGNTDDGDALGPGVTSIPPPPGVPYVAVVVPDAVAFQGPSGNAFLTNITFPDQVTIDTTRYTTDPFTGEDHVPPDRDPGNDPNLYAAFNTNPSSQGVGLGSTPTYKLLGDKAPVNQGVFWWIKRISGGAFPWFWYLKTIQELEYSTYGSDFNMLLPNFSEIIILAIDQRPFPGPPIPIQGFASLEEAVTNAQASGGSVSVGGAASVDLTDYVDQDVPGHAGGLIGIDNWGLWGVLGGAGFGQQINMQNPVARALGFTGGGPMVSPPKFHRDFIFIAGEYPDIWTLTGLQGKRPGLSDPSKPWDQYQNPYLPPSLDLAEQCATTFQTMWNDASAAQDAALLASQGKVVPLLSGPYTPPNWEFNMPFFDTYVGLGEAWSFNAGINCATPHFPSTTVTFPMSAYIGIGQLDPSVWDCTQFPPVKWADEQRGP